MPIAGLAEEQQKTAREAAGADLVYLFGKEGVQNRYQGKLFHVKVCSLPRLAALARATEDLKTVPRGDLELDAATSIGARVQMAEFICSWQAQRSAGHGPEAATGLEPPVPIGTRPRRRRPCPCPRGYSNLIWPEEEECRRC